MSEKSDEVVKIKVPEKFSIYTDQDEALEVCNASDVRAFEQRVSDLIQSQARQLEEMRSSAMTEERAREILGGWVTTGNCLGSMEMIRVSWFPYLVPHEVELEGPFTADQLDAISWWMRNKGKK